MTIIMIFDVVKFNIFSINKCFGNTYHIIIKPKEGNTTPHHRDVNVYKAWVDKDRNVHYIILSNMQNNLLDEFEYYKYAHKM